MIDCLVLGDSIAVGLRVHSGCAIVGEVGISSSAFNRKYSGEFHSGAVIISLGSNDFATVNSKTELESLRRRVTARSAVYWIVPPAKAHLRDVISAIANINGDRVILVKDTHDGVHPTAKSYTNILEQIK